MGLYLLIPAHVSIPYHIDGEPPFRELDLRRGVALSTRTSNRLLPSEVEFSLDDMAAQGPAGNRRPDP